MSKQQKKTKLCRIDKELQRNLMKAMELRYKNKLCKFKDVNMREATELLMKTNGINLGLNEISLKPKRRKQ
tara:strand:+ start:1820 stop:2032 length:213 start_codon:yes stop_codon:yes gene_type:complete